MILQPIHAGRIYGSGVMEVTGLPSGTVYPEIRGQTGRVLYGNEEPYMAVLFDLCPSAKTR
jgi:hypothetical protein